jgi:filamentous hemagglutinin family protein
VVIAIPSKPTLAQITPDTTLGAEGSRITPGTNVQGLPAELIEGGALRETNLFHSFSEFNVNNGQRVYFANPTGIENIFSRVTGNNVSNILGTLGVNGNANLFLLNPNGIIFGSNARLDINGSFLATTANSFQFPGGTQFSATNPQAPPLLSINVPLGVQYGSQPGTIVNTGNLTVGQDLTLAAGTLNLQGQLSAGRDLTLEAQDTAQVRDSTTYPFIASAGGKLVVQGNERIDIFALNHANSGFYSGGDMVLRSANTVGGDAHYWSGASFRIEKLDGSLGNLNSPYDPIILSSGDVSLGNYTGASLHILAGGSVTLSNIEITGTDTDGNTIHPGNTTPFNGTQTIASLASLTLSDGTPITIQGNTIATLDVRAGLNWAALGGFPLLDPTVIGTIPSPPPAPASAANITITGTIINKQPDGLVLLTNQFQPNGLVGNIQVNRIFTSSLFDSATNSGRIIIDSRGNFTPLGRLDTSTFGSGLGGDMMIRAAGDVRLDGVELSSNTFRSGRAGNISIAARSLFLTRGGQITSQSGDDAIGNGGNITLNLSQTLSVDSDHQWDQPSAIFTQVNRRSQGDGGNIWISTGDLSLSNGGEILANNFGNRPGAKAGDITIRATGTVTVDGYRPNDYWIWINDAGSGIGSNIGFGVEDGSTGGKQAGRIDIQAAGLSLQNGGYIASKVEYNENGQGGDILLNILGTPGNPGQLVISGVSEREYNPSGIFSDVEAGTVGNGGTITINTGDLSVTNAARIESGMAGTGNRGGDININASRTVAFDRSGVFSRLSGAATQAGNINITTSSLSLTNYAQLSTSTSGQGNAGHVTINTGNGQVTLQQGSQISSAVEPNATGNAGRISLTAGQLSLIDNSAIVNSVGEKAQGNGGNTEINVPGGNITITGSNSRISNSVQQGAVGNGGIITLNTGDLFVTNGARIDSSMAGTGERGGDININTERTVAFDGEGSGAFSTLSGTAPQAGNINVTTGSLSVTNQALVSTSTSGQGNAGNVRINARNTVALQQQGGIESRVESTGVGNGGNLEISAPTMIITDGASLQADNQATSSSSQAGKIQVRVNNLMLDHNAAITAETFSGNGGDIEITANDLKLYRNSVISTSAGSRQNPGNGGRISIDVRNGSVSAVLSENSDIIANAFGGPGGKITLQARRLIGLQARSGLTPEELQALRYNGTSDISVGSDAGSGTNLQNIQIETQSSDPVQGLIELDVTPVDPAGLIDYGCASQNSRVAKQHSTFFVTGRGGLPPTPDDPLSSGVVPPPWVTRDLGTASNAAPVVARPSSTTKPPLVEAQGMVIGSDGKVILTAEAATATLHPSGFSSQECSGEQ